jgi:hypothetical protein
MDCDRRRGVDHSRRLLHSVEKPFAGDGDLEVSLTRCRCFGRVNRTEQDDLRVDAVRPQNLTFADSRYPEQPGAGIQCGTRDPGRAVPISVGLDDGHELRGLGEGRPERPDIAFDRIKVDNRAGGPNSA